jgi:hypothetical protein
VKVSVVLTRSPVCNACDSSHIVSWGGHTEKSRMSGSATILRRACCTMHCVLAGDRCNGLILLVRCFAMPSCLTPLCKRGFMIN